jgi:hypothetical protein
MKLQRMTVPRNMERLQMIPAGRGVRALLRRFQLPWGCRSSRVFQV